MFFTISMTVMGVLGFVIIHLTEVSLVSLDAAIISLSVLCAGFAIMSLIMKMGKLFYQAVENLIEELRKFNGTKNDDNNRK